MARVSVPALRPLVALPRPALAFMASFLDFVPGVPQTQALAAQLLETGHSVEGENWKVCHFPERRAMRVGGKKVTTTHYISLQVYDPQQKLPSYIQRDLGQNPNGPNEPRPRRIRNV